MLKGGRLINISLCYLHRPIYIFSPVAVEILGAVEAEAVSFYTKLAGAYSLHARK